MHVIHVGPYADRQRREPAALLDAWPSLSEVPAAVHGNGARVSVVQAAAHDVHVHRDGVDFHFVAVRDTHRGALRLARVVRTLEPDTIHLHGLRFPLHVHALRRALPHVPIVAQDHADRAPVGLRARLERPLMAGVDAVVFTSLDQAGPFLRSGVLRQGVSVITIPESSTAFLPGGVSAARRSAGIDGAPCVVWVGRLHEVKDPLTALDAFRRTLDVLPHARLWCAFGDAPLLGRVQAYIDRFPQLRSAVTLLGKLPRGDIEQLLRGADIFLASSRSESTGFALVEALACGATPVVSDIPAFRELTGGGRVGALFPVGNAQGASDALVRVARDLPPREQVRAHFDSQLSPAALGRRLGTAYVDVIARRHRLSVCLLVPGGVDRSGTHRVIPCILALIERLARNVDLHVLALKQEPRPQSYDLLGARVHCVPQHSRIAPVRWLLRHRAQFGFNLLHALWMHPQGTAAAAAGAVLRVPVLLHVNGGDLAELRDSGFGGRASWTGRVRLRAARAGARRVTVPSENMARRAEELGFDAERLTLGVALDRRPVRAPRTRPAGRAFRLLSVGSINRVKDHTTLLRAVALLRARGVDICLDCVGEDTLGGAAARLAAELGLDQVVRFHGFLPYDALRARFEDADALVVSSRHEADPIAALEAAVAGLAVVGTAVGHLTEWAPDAALICEPANAAALAAVITAVVHDESLRLRLARAAQARAVDNNADRAADRVLALYHELAGHA
jgi:glycosyltransferase involved in cell wall biosynthesis